MGYDFWDELPDDLSELDGFEVPEGWDVYSYEKVYPPLLLAMTPKGWFGRLWRKLRGWRRILSAKELTRLLDESRDGGEAYDSIIELQACPKKFWKI